MKYAGIIVDISHEKVDKSFTYAVPPEMEDALQVGMVVSIPFGKGDHLRKGYVVSLSDECGYDPARLKAIESIENTAETTESRLILLASWIRETYGCTTIQALRTVFPIREEMKAREKRRIYAADPNRIRQKIGELSPKRYRARIRLLEALLEAGEEGLDLTEASKNLDASSSVTAPLAEEGLIVIEQENAWRIPFDPSTMEREEKKILNRSQAEALQQILEEWEKPSPRPVLLKGVTGSGKTEVYMELIRRVLAEGKQAIVLIPEIALTYQTLRRFYAQFGNQVSVLHSRLSAGERYDQFRRARSGDARIMVGPRSALFTPFPDLGLIIIDEEHEPAYSSESTPRYLSRDTAVFRASCEGARVVMGSATPSMEAYYKASAGEYRLVTLEGRHENRALPEVAVVDMREELRNGNRSVLSRELRQDMEDSLGRGEQVMLFLNRRGYAGFVSCRSCGYVMKCPHCDVSLSQHRTAGVSHSRQQNAGASREGNSAGKMICHYCGYETETPRECPDCGSRYIGGFRAGTEQIEQILSKEFPESKILRMDLDTTRTRGSYEKILSGFASHEADILIGTQMIVKGHDFPDVTLVGVLSADLSLNEADFRCGERTMQLLMQAAGRSGRGSRPGKAVIQTYHPEHYSIQAAASQDYDRFYKEEIAYRMLMNYPPAAHLLIIHGTCEEEGLLHKAMFFLRHFAERNREKTGLTTIGPAPESISRINDMYRMALYLRHPDEKILIRIRKNLEKYVEVNTGFRTVYLQYELR